MTKSKQNGLTHLDPEKIDRARLRLGLSKTAIADKTGLSRSTVLKAFRGEGIVADSVKRIAMQLEFSDPCEMLHDAEPAATDEVSNSEWEVDQYLGPWLTASNQIQFRLCRMRHRYIKGRYGRGKCYDLLNPSQRESNRVREYLLRHPEVCTRVRKHPRIADNLATFPGAKGDVWWVIDDWFEGDTLEDQWESGGWQRDRTPQLAWDLAQGLSALHQAGVVFRELSPNHILLSSIDGRACLTDFELAKLLEPTPTVSTEWPDDIYRAPEVENGHSSVQADFYSWAMIVVHGFFLNADRSSSALPIPKKSDLPLSLRHLLENCLSPAPSDRPCEIFQILAVLEKTWPQLTSEERLP